MFTLYPSTVQDLLILILQVCVLHVSLSQSGSLYCQHKLPRICNFNTILFNKDNEVLIILQFCLKEALVHVYYNKALN